MSPASTHRTAATAAVGAFVFGLAAAAHAQDDPCGEAFRPYAAMLADRLVISAEALAKRVEAGDLEGAKRAWIEAGIGWERGEPFFAAYFPEAAAAIDGWPNAETGFHAVETVLFEQEDVAAARDVTRELVGAAAELQWRLATVDLRGPELIDGMVDVTAKIGHAKANGGESPLAGTSMLDLKNNLQGIETLYGLSFASITRRHNPRLHARIIANLIALDSALRAASFEQIEGATVLTLTEQLSDDFAEVALVIELEGTGAP